MARKPRKPSDVPRLRTPRIDPTRMDLWGAIRAMRAEDVRSRAAYLSGRLVSVSDDGRGIVVSTGIARILSNMPVDRVEAHRAMPRTSCRCGALHGLQESVAVPEKVAARFARTVTLRADAAARRKMSRETRAALG